MSTTGLDAKALRAIVVAMQDSQQSHQTERVLAFWGMPRVVISEGSPATAAHESRDNVLRFPDGRCIARGPRDSLVSTARLLGLTLAS